MKRSLKSRENFDSHFLHNSRRRIGGELSKVNSPFPFFSYLSSNSLQLLSFKPSDDEAVIMSFFVDSLRRYTITKFAQHVKRSLRIVIKRYGHLNVTLIGVPFNTLFEIAPSFRFHGNFLRGFVGLLCAHHFLFLSLFDDYIIHDVFY